MFYSTASVLTIKDLASQISAMAPIIISVNGGEYYWSDDLDLTNINDKEEEMKLLRENMKQYQDVLNLNLIVKNISFEIVDYHHSIVNIVAE